MNPSARTSNVNNFSYFFSPKKLSFIVQYCLFVTNIFFLFGCLLITTSGQKNQKSIIIHFFVIFMLFFFLLQNPANGLNWQKKINVYAFSESPVCLLLFTISFSASIFNLFLSASRSALSIYPSIQLTEFD